MNQELRGPRRPARPDGRGASGRNGVDRGQAFEGADQRGAPGPGRQHANPQGFPISRPSPMPQWPLTNNFNDGGGQRNGSPPSQAPASQVVTLKAPPRRPPRPSYVPSILDASRVQDHTPAFQYRQQQAQAATQPHAPQQGKYWEPNYAGSPQEPITPGSGLSGASVSSRPSTASSYGSIPDFPAPSIPVASQPQPLQGQSQPQSQLTVQPRRSIGPPPSSRRGASSYYSHNSFVAPIPEEIPESPKMIRGQRGPQHSSYASSHVIPQSWANGPPGYYTGAYPEDIDDEEDYRDGRESRESDHDESSNLVRKASVGKQFKPTLTTVRSSSSSESDELKAGMTANSQRLGNLQSERMRTADLNNQAYVAPQGLRSQKIGALIGTGEAIPSTPDSPQDPRVGEIMGGLERGGAIERGVTPPLVATPPRRPPRLDMNAVHEAEKRGSLTSLTDLIRRATKVRTNLDRGKTASRLGMLDFGSNPNLLDRRSPNHKRNSDSLSGILASFPPPALTPQGDRPTSRWPSPFANSNLNLATSMTDQKDEHQQRKSGRKCCGLPMWAFSMLLILLILLIAAAVVVPIILIVLPRMRDQNNAAADLSKCATNRPCANGQSVVSSNQCRCVCTGGFTGADCSQPSDPDCTQSTAGAFRDATMGNSIPRLLSSAQNKFSVPLNSTLLLSTFAATNISCSDEEALVTFNGRSQRRSAMPQKADNVAPLPSITAPAFLAKAAQDEVPSAVTSNSVVLDAAAGTPVPTAQTITGNAPTATTQSEATPMASNSPPFDDLDFARIAVLWVLQETQQLNAAVNAQQILRTKLGKIFTVESVDLGAGIKVDFSKHQISSNETRVGS